MYVKWSKMSFPVTNVAGHELENAGKYQSEKDLLCWLINYRYRIMVSTGMD